MPSHRPLAAKVPGRGGILSLSQFACLCVLSEGLAQELPGFQVVLGVLSLLSFAAVFEDYALSGSTAWFTCSARSPDLTAIASRLHASETL